jgi:hypothetical protein
MEAGQVRINNVAYPLAAEGLLPYGRRSLERFYRPSQISDPARIRQATWQLWGPQGNSREKIPVGAAEGFLGVDYANVLDHYYDDLLTSAPARTALDLSSADPSQSSSLLPFTLPTALGGFAIGNVSHISEDRNFLIFARGQAHTWVRPSDMTVRGTKTLPAAIEGQDVWRNQVRIGLGAGAFARSVTQISATDLVYTDSAVQVKAMRRGSDRLWMVEGDSSGGVQNRIKWTQDDMSTFSNTFLVGDDKIPATGLGVIGPFLIVGSEIGAFSFSQAGKPVSVMNSVKDHRSANNALSQDDGPGWHYICSALGLKAIQPGVKENPVGPGDLPGYEGPSGRPTAVRYYKDSIFLAELVGSDLRISRGRFGSQTERTGRLDWYNFYNVAGVTCEAIGATSNRTNPTILFGEDDDVARYTLAERSREIEDSNYVFGTDGGTWFGTTMMRSQAMLNNLRQLIVLSENCDGSNTWQAAVSVNEGSYVNVGSAVSGNGLQRLRPVSGGAPLTSVGFSTIKPRLTQVAGSSSSPPQLRGPMTGIYDERPEQIQEVQFILQLGQGERADTQFTALEALVTDTQQTPDIQIKLPTDPDGTSRYAFLTGMREMDLKEDQRGIEIQATVWETS